MRAFLPLLPLAAAALGDDCAVACSGLSCESYSPLTCDAVQATTGCACADGCSCHRRLNASYSTRYNASYLRMAGDAGAYVDASCLDDCAWRDASRGAVWQKKPRRAPRHDQVRRLLRRHDAGVDRLRAGARHNIFNALHCHLRVGRLRAPDALLLRPRHQLRGLQLRQLLGRRRPARDSPARAEEAPYPHSWFEL